MRQSPGKTRSHTNTANAESVCDEPAELSSKPIIAGIVLISGGALWLVLGGYGIAASLNPRGDPANAIFALFLPTGIVALVGGYCSLRRILWGMALAGAIMLTIYPPFSAPWGIPALILLLGGRKDFTSAETRPH